VVILSPVRWADLARLIVLTCY